jgi:phage regulator Rha-like protein
MNNQNIPVENIQNRIFNIRNVQVMLDSHLAEMYQVETKVLNQAVKRNIERFPDSFRFRLTLEEYNNCMRLQTDTSGSRSQIVTLNAKITDTKTKRGQNLKYLPYVFTEQGVAMLSPVLRSQTAVKVSIRIMQAFVEMRKLVLGNAALFQRLDKVELKQIEADQKFEQVFKALEKHQQQPEKGIFYDGQVFDAWTFVSDIIRSADYSIILIDNYIDDIVFTLFGKRKPGVQVTFYTKTISKQLQLDAQKHNTQYEPIEIKQMAAAHDRFLIIDETELYHLGASLKDLGKKWFAFSKMDSGVGNMLNLLKIKTNE